jgi:hypothetical protein
LEYIGKARVNIGEGRYYFHLVVNHASPLNLTIEPHPLTPSPASNVDREPRVLMAEEGEPEERGLRPISKTIRRKP